MTDPWMDRLSEYLDASLEREERTALEAHLSGCTACRTTLEELRAVAARASTLPDRPPTGDLWGGVAARIGADNRSPVPAPRRPRFTAPQLLAAGIAIALLSTAMVLVLRGPPLGPATLANRTAPVAATSPATGSYERAAGELAQILAAGRDQLDPRTIRILERNLLVIDGAIREAQQAVAEDPASLYLQHHLAQTKQRKLEILRHAAQLVAASS